MFPEKLAIDFVTTWSNPGELVLDPFCGSGTTPLAAKELNREWVGVELNPKYCAIAEGRLSQDVLQLETCAMRPNHRICED
jgi:site-specific DNA-methyltransferase (adenine-specific)